MALTIIEEPAEIVFSRNPVVFGFQTDNLYNSEGQAAVYLLAFPLGPLAEGVSFSISYGSGAIIQTFTVKNYPNDSGLELIAGKDHPLKPDETILAWCEACILAFESNYLLSRDFTFSIDTTGTDPRVKVTSRLLDSYFNISVSESIYITSAELTNGVKKERNTNFKIYYEVWIENDDHTGFDKAVKDVPADPDDNGIIRINISKTLSESLRGPLNDFDTPDAALPLAFHAKKTARRYYLRYAEAYGSVQTVRKMQTTDIKWTLLGGVGKFKQTSYSIPVNFYVESLHRFLKIEPVSKSVKLTQPEWLSMVWLTDVPATIQLKIKVYYSTGDPTEVTKYPFTGLLKYDKVTFPSGCTQLDLPALDIARIITKYEVWVENAADSTVLSEVRTYTLDYVQNAARFIIELSSFGVYDTFQCYGKGATSYELSSDKAVISRSAIFNFSKGEVIDFDNSIQQRETIRTGWQTRREIARYRDLFLSWDKFLVRNGRMYPISTDIKSIKEFDDNVHLYGLEFEIGFRYSEELYSEEDDPDQAISLAQFIPLISNPTPENYDILYYRKSQTYNKAEIDASIANILDIEAAHHTAQQALIDGIITDLVGKADVNHDHDLDYVQILDFNIFADAVGDALIYKGLWITGYSVDPLDPEVILGYRLNDIVDYAGTFWRSLAEENEAMPGTDPAKWGKIIESKTQLSVTSSTTIDWQADLIPGKDYTWAQKYGNDLPGTAGAWWDNGSKWERFEGFQIEPTYSGATLLSVAITADLYPLKINLI